MHNLCLKHNPDDKTIISRQQAAQPAEPGGPCVWVADTQLNGESELPEGMETPGTLAAWPEFAVHSHQRLQLLSHRGDQQFMLLHIPRASNAVWSPG